MLQTQTVNPTLLRLLSELMRIEAFQDLILVGGTSLALQIGHRESIDIDLFGKVDFDLMKMSDVLNKIGKVNPLSLSQNINIILIDNIKIDFVNYRYPWLFPPKEIDNIRFASFEDVAAMKLNAIAGRGSKKDFIDLYCLLDHFSINEMLDFYNNKYDDGNLFLVEKSLTYFDDADKERTPKLFVETSWEEIKEEIRNKFLNR